jgi:hypothetical protein
LLQTPQAVQEVKRKEESHVATQAAKRTVSTETFRYFALCFRSGEKEIFMAARAAKKGGGGKHNGSKVKIIQISN